MKLLIIILFLFSSFLFFIGMLRLLFYSKEKIEKRVDYYLISKKKSTIDKKNFNLLVEIQLLNQKIRNSLPSGSYHEKLEHKLSRSGVPLLPQEFILLQWISTIITGGILYLVSKKIFFLVLGSILGYMVPKWMVNRKHQKRIVKFNEGLADMITIIIGSLKAGFSFPQALKSVVEEADTPIKEEIDLVLREMQYGGSIEDALHHLHERVPSNDLELMIQAILIQRQVGGNLATVLDTIVQTIRDRNSIQRQVLTLTAQGRLSGMVIGSLPIFLGLIIYLISPDYISILFTHPVGIGMLVAGALMGIIGFIFIRKLTTIEV